MGIANISGNILTDSGTNLSSLVSGTGTTNYLPKFTGASTIGDSLIQDNGTTITLGGALSGTSATFTGSVTSDDVIFTAGTLFGTGVTGFSNRASDTTLYLQMPATGFNITDNALNTRFILSSAGAATFSNTLSVNTDVTMLRFGNLTRWGFQRPAADNRYVSFMRNMNATATPVWTVDGDNGNVGIGTSSPALNLHIFTSGTSFTSSTITYSSATSRGILLDNSAGTSQSGNGIWFANSGLYSAIASTRVNTGNWGTDLRFYTHPDETTNQFDVTERMRITSGGGVYVGTTGGINANINNEFKASQSNGGVAVLAANNSSTFAQSPAFSCYKGSNDTSANNRFIQFYSNGEAQPMGGIVGNGANNAQFGTISDIREKENIISINGSLDKILSLNPVSFDWKKTKEHITAGFIAQEVEEIFPEYVVENMANEGEEARKGLTGGMTSGIISHLVKAIQEQNQLILELSAKVTALENK